VVIKRAINNTRANGLGNHFISGHQRLLNKYKVRPGSRRTGRRAAVTLRAEGARACQGNELLEHGRRILERCKGLLGHSKRTLCHKGWAVVHGKTFA